MLSFDIDDDVLIEFFPRSEIFPLEYATLG